MPWYNVPGAIVLNGDCMAYVHIQERASPAWHTEHGPLGMGNRLRTGSMRPSLLASRTSVSQNAALYDVGRALSSWRRHGTGVQERGGSWEGYPRERPGARRSLYHHEVLWTGRTGHRGVHPEQSEICMSLSCTFGRSSTPLLMHGTTCLAGLCSWVWTMWIYTSSTTPVLPLRISRLRGQRWRNSRLTGS